ncbi:MAG: acyl-CoA dehydrogenase family protein [Thermoplasmatales archaeon]|jgi:isovaleryl-CoA dehydrogenase|nr:acyl-CoA dehydrogenase family protein [Candidatus Thermoplasmatota archaeon]MDA8054554.1 acyl-CoA dehydrogenase family protein [Thermoplasmatales archaeon]
MDFNIPDDAKSIRDKVSDFMTREVVPLISKLERDSSVMVDIFKKMGKLGLLGITIPEEFGGSGMDFLTLGIVLEEVSYFSGSLALSYGAHSNLVMDNIFRNGSAEQREEFIPPMVKGERIGSLCLTEPGGGSDAIGSMKTSYVSAGDAYVLNGTKTFITNAPLAGTFLIYARNGNNYSAFVAKKEDGIETPRQFEKLGVRGSPTGDVVMKDVSIPLDRVLGREGEGKKIIYGGLNAERAIFAFMPLGLARRALDESIRYSQVREQFGNHLSEFELIQEKIAYMFTKIEAARLLAYKAAKMAGENVKDPSYAAASIMNASEMATQVTKDALQIFGGYGYSTDFPVERLFRDSIIAEIGAGTTEIRKIVIARYILGKFH